MGAARHGARPPTIQAALDPYIELLFAPPLRDFRARLKAVLAADGVIAGHGGALAAAADRRRRGRRPSVAARDAARERGRGVA